MSMLTPQSHTPLIALPVLVVDLETTGLDVKNDRIVQVAAKAMLGDKELYETALDSLVNPRCAIPAASTAIHNISDSDVATAPSLVELAEKIKLLFTGRVIVGHNIGFDIGVLRHEFARHDLVWQEPVSIDIRQLVGALQPNLPDLSLETITTNFGIKIENRHTAMGDCTATADVWAKLVTVLRENDIRTLSEVRALANQRQDLILGQHQAGWFDVPAGLDAQSSILGLAIATPRIDSYVFEHYIKDVMHHPAITIDASKTLTDAAAKMVDQQVGCLLITDTENHPVGIITESDILRSSANKNNELANMPIAEVMTSPVECIHKNDMLYRALSRMDRLRICHLCVTDASEQALGMISQRDLLQYRARGTQMLSDAIDFAEDTASLAAAYSQATSVARQLRNEQLNGCEIARVISTELRAATACAAKLVIRQLEQDGEGQAPADWCVFVLGSGGRGESLLTADQDNALIHAGSIDDDSWFQEFGLRLANILDEIGIPFCQGKVMASSPQWRGNIEQWNERIEHWISRANSDDILNVDIFYDLIPVAGQLELAKTLHRNAIRVAANSPTFINLMAQSVRGFAPRFGMLGKLASEAGRVNLKRDGLLPLVSFARTLALRIGSVSRATPERLRDAIAENKLAKKDGERLIVLHQNLLTHVLNQQLEDINSGIPAGSKVVTKSLDSSDYNMLIKDLKHLDTMVNEIQSFISH